ncbi:MAG: alpha/beta fold hydrolase [Aureispira sp.]
MAFEKVTGIQQFDFQINRVLTYGEEACYRQEVLDAMMGVSNFKIWFDKWLRLAQKAEAEKRFLHAGYYYRMAEFFLSEKDVAKEEMYTRSLHNFQRVIVLDEGVEEFTVPYQGKSLKTLVFLPKKELGELVMFGGYDSFIEEFYLAVKDFVKQGYKVTLFEGPGQGSSLKKGLYFDHRWELPVAAVLDYFELQEVTLIGISWGGYFALRAAAYEKRIKRVVAYDILYDGFDCMLNQFPSFLKMIFQMLFRFQQSRWINRFLNYFMRKKMPVDWAITHGMYITGTATPYDFYVKLQAHSLQGHTSKIEADVLLLAGENDHYIPLKHYHILRKELTNVKRLKGRIFTKEEGGEQHCQVGNHGLAIKEILEWLKYEEE